MKPRELSRWLQPRQMPKKEDISQIEAKYNKFLEYWKKFPVSPAIGSLIDGAGTETDKTFLDLSKKFSYLSANAETSFGKIEVTASDGGLDVFAEDIGLSLYYNEKGKLGSMNIDLFNFCDIDPEADEKVVGEQDLKGLLESLILESDREITVYFNFAEKSVEVVSEDKLTRGSETLFFGKDEDIFMSNYPLIIDLDEYVLYLDFSVLGDELSFGVSAMLAGEEVPEQERMKMSTKILMDLNYNTFLSSDSEKKYEHLIDRILLKKYI